MSLRKEPFVMKKKIWFNRWFSTAYHFIEAIKNNPDGIDFEIYGTHPNRNTVYLHVCDYAEIEPEVNGEEYINFCLEFCKKHGIDVFIPYQHALEISQAILRFQEIGTKVMVCEDFASMEIISHKGKLYESFVDNGLGHLVPEYRVVQNAAQFMEEYKRLRSLGKVVCIKPADGRGGEGFRIIRDAEDTIIDLFGHISHYISFNEAYKILSKQDRFEELMVMEYLSGYEFSIDCLSYDGQLLAAVPRKKEEGRIRQLEDIPELMEIAGKVNDIYQIPYVYNVQIKYNNGLPKLLEINPRMSGGLHISSLSGVNFAYLALKLMLTGDADIVKPNLQVKATHVEKSVLLSS